MTKNLLLLVAFWLASFSLYAQERTITGKIIAGDDNSPLPGVNILIKGTARGASSNADGTYSISATENDILIFSFVGYDNQEVAVGNRSTIDVALQPDIKSLNEVVVIGYGTQAKRDLTGAVSSINGSQIVNTPVQSFDQALQGRAAGVNITTPNGVLNNPPVIRIRGVNSISLSSFPLVVVDGVPTFTLDNSSNSAANNPLSNINPADIESVEVLKDASATAIYGSRASAGVILITTKRGSKGKAKITYDGWAGLTQPVKLLKLLNADQYMMIKNEASRNAPIGKDQFFPYNDVNGKPINTDWYKEVYRTGFSHSHNIGFSGGTDNTNYYASIGYTDQQGIVKNNNYNRTILRINLDHKVSSKFKMGVNFNYSNSISKATNTGSLSGQAFNSGGLARLAFLTAPNIGSYLNDGSFNVNGANIGNMNNLTQSGIYNPVVLLNNDYATSDGNQIQGAAYANWEIIKGLNLKTSYGINNLSIEDKSYLSPLNGDGFSVKGQATNYNNKNTRWNWQNTLQYDRVFSELHSFSLLIGNEQQYTKFDAWGAQQSASSDNFFNTFQGNFTNIVPNNSPQITNPSQSSNYLVSFFGRLNYNFNRKYYATFNIRRDGYSAFSKDNKYGNFYGGSIGYVLSDENFWKNSPLVNVINFVKLRASYGRVGNNQGIPDFASLNLYGASLYANNPTIYYYQAGNTKLKWETSTKTDIGVTLGVFNDKITGEFAYYNNQVDNLILRVPQSPTKGIPNPSLPNTILQNIGSMTNSGIEISLKSTPIKTEAFSWTINANLTTLKNTVTALYGENSEIRTATAGLETANITKVGYSVSSLVAVPTVGINPLNGRREFLKADGTIVQYDQSAISALRWTKLDGTPTTPASNNADGKIYGSTLPTWYGGFDNNFKYKDFDLGVFVQFSGGNYIYNGTKAGLHDQRYWNNSTDILDRWTPEKTNGSFPRVVYGDNVSNGSSFPISENIEKGNFIRGRNISLGYTFNKNAVSKFKIANARLYVQVQNAFLITKYKGFDPEISTNGNSTTSSGIDRNSIGQARIYTIGINLGL